MYLNNELLHHYFIKDNFNTISLKNNNIVINILNNDLNI